MRRRTISVLYVAYWGAAEPLGQSLILPSLKRLSEHGIRFTLVTFDKTHDVRNAEEIAAIRQELEQHGIRWISLRYHKAPQAPAKLFDVAHGLARSLLRRLHGRFDVVHARTFVGGLIGLPLAALLRTKLIYHNEGFYPDEQVDGGVWAEGSLRHRLARSLEASLYSRADAIIALSHRAKAEIATLPSVRRRHTPVTVAPSTVDLDRFQYPEDRSADHRDGVRLVYVGSIGLRYLFDRAVAFAAVTSEELGRVRLSVLTRADRASVGRVLGASELPATAWSVDTVPHAAMPKELLQHDAGLFFLTQGLSEHGCSPTKVGEYWACGLPVITTPNVSDTDEIVRRERVGVIVPDHSPAGYRAAARELGFLLKDPDLPARCRRAAEAHYSLADACQRQVGLYETLLA